jgi:hypothetical protein
VNFHLPIAYRSALAISHPSTSCTPDDRIGAESV